jgi:syntaxin 5
MAMSLIQDRTSEFRTLIQAASKKLARNNAHQRLLAPDKPAHSRGEFARRAADIGRSITNTMGKLERLAQCLSSPPAPCVTD